ncbi:MAG TPA: selenocysteine-specific translation elongation factor [Actinomycetota bacterium]
MTTPDPADGRRPGTEDARDLGYATPPLHVVATAGHVDHGKSTLIRRLTGIEPDRLVEEKRRGLTIDLGFAWLTLPSNLEIGFVDVPGHERFVRTMLAGMGPVRLALFVVAADEGWSRQSEEHLAIVDVLGADGAVVALTKSDLVDARRLAEVSGNVTKRLAGTALEGAPVVPCSAVTGAGLGELTTALDAMVLAAPRAAEGDRIRLHVDRVFTIAGAGTVVTGTLTGGPLAVGDEVDLHPSGIRARIRGLQTHKRRIELARPVSRVAVNLAGIERMRLERGDVLTRPGEWQPTSTLEAWVGPVRGLDHPVTGRGAFTFHAGAAERTATLRLYDTSALPDDGAFARVRLSAPLVLDVHDRFVLRESGRRETVAGGLVLDPFPPRRPGADAAVRLDRRRNASRSLLPAVLLAERGAVRRAELASQTGEGTVDGLEPMGGWWVAPPVRASVEGSLVERLRALHEANPSADGAGAATVRGWALEALRLAGAPADGDLADVLVEDLAGSGVLARTGATVRLPSHRPGVATEEVDRIAATVAAGEPSPPTIADLRRSGVPAETIEAAIRAGALIRVGPELVMTPGFVDKAVEVVRSTGSRGITVSEVRRQLGTTRKYAVPLMEHLDRSGLTRRSGDLRFARGT